MAGRIFLGALWGWCMLAASPAQAQFAFQYDQSIPVTGAERTLAMPWGGGLNAAQYNTLDLNGDTQSDLVIYDRTANQVRTFIFRAGKYEYNPAYELQFPSGISSWLLLRDFNCDGRKDIFTSDPFGIRAFVNTTRGNGPLSWRPYNNGDPVFTKGFSGNINLKVNETDIPAIDDVDGDGDLDILNFRFVGFNTVEYHRNFARERTGTCDSLQLERITQTFGGFEDCSCGRIAFGQTCGQPGGGRSQHAGGKSLLLLDMNNDGDQELVYSEESCSQLYMLENTGTAATAKFESYQTFPSAQPVAIPFFPAAYFEDVDGDGRRDLLATPTQYARSFSTIDFQRSNWFYKNKGTNDAPQFTFVTNQFLQSEMIDVGDFSTPACFDFDNDGDQDLFVGFYADTNSKGGIYLYENIGQTTAAFRLLSTDFAGLNLLNLYNFKPQFSDLNRDGKADLVFTATHLQSGQTSLYFLPNRATAGLDVSTTTLQTTAVRIGQNENLTLVDVDLDGAPDALWGRSNGSLQFWRNVGTGSIPDFALTGDAFLGLAASTSRQNLTTAAGDLDGDGNTDLVVGDPFGTVVIYPHFRSGNAAPVADWLVLDGKVVTRRNLGGRVWPAVVDLFPDARPALLLGNTLGGLSVLRPTDQTELDDDPTITIYPNPVPSTANLFIRTDRAVQVQFFTTLGQPLHEPITIAANQSTPLHPGRLAPGLYLVRITSRGKSYGRRVVVTR